MKKTKLTAIAVTYSGTREEICAELTQAAIGWKHMGKPRLAAQAAAGLLAIENGSQGVTVGHYSYVVGPDLPDLENVVQTCAQIASAGQDDPLSDIAEVLCAIDEEHQAVAIGRQSAEEIPDADHVVTREELADWGQSDHVVVREALRDWSRMATAYGEDVERYDPEGPADEGLPVPVMVEELPERSHGCER